MGYHLGGRTYGVQPTHDSNLLGDNSSEQPLDLFPWGLVICPYSVNHAKRREQHQSSTYILLRTRDANAPPLMLGFHTAVEQVGGGGAQSGTQTWVLPLHSSCPEPLPPRTQGSSKTAPRTCLHLPLPSPNPFSLFPFSDPFKLSATHAPQSSRNMDYIII